MDRRPPFPPDFSLYLASQSPRRRELLAGLTVPFVVVAAIAEERLAGAAPEALAEANACAKAAGAHLPPDAPPGAFVLGTDTIVVVEGQPLGKAADQAEAAEMLRLLSGRRHHVISGVALARLGSMGVGDERSVVSGWAVTAVDVQRLSDGDLEAYVASGEWEDKAGAYAIQGLAALFIEGIEGEYGNVVGLPVHLLAALFRRHGFDLLRRTWLR